MLMWCCIVNSTNIKRTLRLGVSMEKERSNFEKQDNKNEMIDRFLFLAREAAAIDNEMLKICTEIEEKYQTNMEEQIDIRRQEQEYAKARGWE